MKNMQVLKKYLIFLIMCSVLILLNIKSSYATSVSLSQSSVSIKAGETKTVTLTGSDATGKIVASSSNTGIATVSADNWVENNSITITITGKSEGNATINITGTVSNSEGTKDIDIQKSISVAVSAHEEAVSTAGGTTTSEQTQKPVSTSKSSNANLSNLGIRPNDFSGFKAGTTTYNVTVPNTVSVVEVYGKAQDSKAQITGTGSKNLNTGKNALSVIVIAEDGTKKTYTINVTREEKKEEEKQEENVATEEIGTKIEEGDGLSELKIDNISLSPEFKSNVYEYAAKYIGTDEKFNITATGTDPYYNIEVVGNEAIKEGENTITILVTNPDGENVATYQVIINKSLQDYEAIEKEQKEDNKKKMIIICGVIAIVVLIVIIILIKRKRNKSYNQEYNEYEIPYLGLNNNHFEEENQQDYQENDREQYDESDEILKQEDTNIYNEEKNQEFEDVPRKKRAKGKRFK